MRIWDTILSDPHGRMDCLLRICTAMILNIRHVLIAGDFTTILKTLQRYPPVDVNVLLQVGHLCCGCVSRLPWLRPLSVSGHTACVMSTELVGEQNLCS